MEREKKLPSSNTKRVTEDIKSDNTINMGKMFGSFAESEKKPGNTTHSHPADFKEKRVI